ncbi:MAG: hypothetical protein ACOYM3_23615, partial [Terrimicrobiaceae bacterium]
RVSFGSDTPEFIDLMGNVRAVKPVNGFYEIPLSPAPLFIRGPKGSAARLANVLNKSEVLGSGSEIRAEVRPGSDGKLAATLSNKTAHDLSGKITVGSKITPFKIPASGKIQIALAGGLPTEPGKMQEWKDSLKIVLANGTSIDVACSLAWFYVPQATLPMDPNADAWKKVPSVPLTNWRLTVDPKTNQKVKGGYPGDLEARFQLAWDKDNLYLRVEGATNHFVLPDGGNWDPKGSDNRRRLCDHGFSVETYFDGFANGRGNLSKGFDQDDFRYDFFVGNGQASDGPGSVWRMARVFHQLAGGITQPTDDDCASGRDVKCEFRRTEGHFAYVMRFPLRYIMPIELTKGYTAGFGLYLHDMEPGDKGPMKGLSLATEPGAHCNFRPDLWPLMILK